MKNSIKHILQISVISCAFMFACEDFEETNTNPNQPEDVPRGYLFTYAVETIMDQVYGGFDNSRVGMTLAQYWSQNQYTEESRYQYRPATNNTTWNTIYTGIYNLQEIIRLNEEDELTGSDNEIAIATIMQVWTYQFLTDLYGDIPYENALLAKQDTLAPAYSRQQDIYPDLLRRLRAARDMIDVAAPGFASGDIIYDGDMELWRKFANSLMLRVAIRMVDRMEQESLAAITEAYTSGVFEDYTETAQINYLASQPATNPLYVDVIVGNRNDFSSSNTLIDVLLARNDPRINAYFAPAKNSGQFIGRPYGQNAAAANALVPDAVSQLSAKILSPDLPGLIMDAAEVKFILAEAVQRGAALGKTAADFYGEGIRESMEYWEVATPAQIDNYILANPYDAGNWKQSLGVQKWIALYMQGFQGWAEYRRLDFTGILKMPVSGPLVSINQVPVRRTYPPDEQTLNRQNYITAIEKQGPDELTTKVWWDLF
ncbi:SusD/RagB family nutrient-binding outer membrane lipoprotein [Chryseosolibacter indicus]|uniref:SusD/RagB family nutrient-binding outer membrane lipoprotein n=1 Tax=Chryseosolibacter indicus TaxID=2782351 RepID=A0ABS5VT44_9BACT|nr:SusD/RagB family nutrient-binding outer membrane lipoprotein [Chryseosolibacter indicus]MBT1704526.1 SusD/RagB family nutrient-binding outer membrane lipoprotein [Chryseosolibacter indicus]